MLVDEHGQPTEDPGSAPVPGRPGSALDLQAAGQGCAPASPAAEPAEDRAGEEDAGALVFNGVDAETGRYGLPPMTLPELAGLARRVTFLEGKALVEDQDVHDLASAGWGVIFPAAGAGARKEALAPLLARRRAQAGERYRELIFQPGDGKESFLRRHRVAPGNPADPRRLPYYLLLAGSPEEIPFDFQYRLDVQYAVGRLHFERPEEYEAYARTVVRSEEGGLPAAGNGVAAAERRMTFFGVRNPGDRATELSEEALVRPLARNLRRRGYDGWRVSAVRPQSANKARLLRLLGGRETPSLLFTASHGVCFPHGHRRQLAEQGGLVCSEWPGPEAWNGPVPRDHYLTADDVPDGADLQGLVAFFFACYGAGTPRFDAFSHRQPGPPAALAPAAFVSRLPQRLLGHPRGGALAVIGHVERAWGCSFLWGGAGSQPQTFEDTLRRLMKGYRVGAAAEKLNQRYAELAVDLTMEIERDRLRRALGPPAGRPSPLAPAASENREANLARRWTAHNDARSYVVLGDPAVRLCQPIGS